MLANSITRPTTSYVNGKKELYISKKDVLEMTNEVNSELSLSNHMSRTPQDDQQCQWRLCHRYEGSQKYHTSVAK